jgi:hypothetical protein
MTTLPPSLSRLSEQCGILNISQPYRPPRLAAGIASLALIKRLAVRDLSENTNLSARVQLIISDVKDMFGI